MKKQKLKKLASWNRFPKTHMLGALVAVALIASAGVYTILSSFAASNGTITLILVDQTKGSYVGAGNGYVSLAIVNSGTPLCSNMDGLTDASGRVVFNGCTSGVPYKVTFITFKGGWYTVSPSSGINTGTQIGIGSAATSMTSFIAVVPVDSDNDGVPNMSDKCVTSAGPASNNGCPVPAPTPPTPTPNPSSPAPTPKTPAPSSSTTKKSTTATSPKITNSSPAPAVASTDSGDKTPPSSPENLIISRTGDSIFLSWDEASDNEGVMGYTIESSSDNENWLIVATGVTDTFYTDDNPDNSSGHVYYRVRATDAAGNQSEATLGDIELASNKTATKPKTATQASKKNNNGLAIGLVLAVLLVLGALSVAFIFLRRRLSSDNTYSYDTGDMLPGANLSSATVMPNQSPQQQSPQPTYNYGPPSQHTSVSLKEMVLEEMNKNGQNHPPTIPPPAPPSSQT